MNNSIAKRKQIVLDNIRKLRQYRNYTQDYVASKVRLSQNQYGKIELGNAKLTIDRLFLISEVLGVEPVQVLTLSLNELIKYSVDDNKR